MAERASSLRDARVLVTGAAGFIGSHLVRALVERGAIVHVALRSPIGGAPRLAGVAAHVHPHLADFTDAPALHALVRHVRPEIIYHLAADTSARVMDSRWQALETAISANLLGTVRLLAAAHEAGTTSRFIRLGGLEEYGAGPMPYLESQRESPVSPYSASQVAATHFAGMLQQHANFSIATLRPALVYGAHQSRSFLIPDLIARGLRGDPLVVRAGNRGRDLVHVDDLVRAMLDAAGTALPPAFVCNIASGQQYRMREVATRIHALTGARSELQIEDASGQAGVLDDLYGSGALASSCLGWHPQVSLDEGLRRTIESEAAALAAPVQRA